MSSQSNESTPLIFTQVVFQDNFINPLTLKKIQFIEQALPYFGNARTNPGSSEKSTHYYSIADQKFIDSSLMREITERFSCIVNRKLVVRRAIFRNSQFGELNEIHQDYFEPGYEKHFFTAVLFLNDNWELGWEGAFSLLNMENGTAFSIYPKSNRALIFQSSLHHTISSPCRDCYVSRKVLVVNFHEKGIS
jgi:hypothetical protein